MQWFGQTLLLMDEIGVYGANPRYVEVYGRSRFGRSDLGVNAKRVDAWLAQVEAR